MESVSTFSSQQPEKEYFNPIAYGGRARAPWWNTEGNLPPVPVSGRRRKGKGKKGGWKKLESPPSYGTGRAEFFGT